MEGRSTTSVNQFHFFKVRSLHTEKKDYASSSTKFMNCGGNLPTRLYASVDQKNGKRNLDPFRLEKPGSIEAKTKKDAKRNRTKLTLETSQCEADGRRDLTSDKITNCHIQKRMPSRAFNLRNLNGFLYNGRRWSKRAYVFSRRWPRTNDSRTIFRCPVYIEQLQSSE